MRFLFADKKPEKRKNICLDLTKNIKAYEMTFFLIIAKNVRLP